MVIALKDVSKVYTLGDNDFLALSSLNFEVKHGELVALTGASGSGKSTLLNILGCLDVPSSGDYYLDGYCVSGLNENDLAMVRNEKIGFVFQNFHLLPRMTALENVMLPLVYRGVPPDVRKKLAKKSLESVGLASRLAHKPNELSGGQRQRVAIARALVGNPEIILADEPTGNLDSKTATDIMGLLLDLHAKGKTLIIVTHESDIANRCKRIVRLHDGQVSEDGQGISVGKVKQGYYE